MNSFAKKDIQPGDFIITREGLSWGRIYQAFKNNDKHVIGDIVFVNVECGKVGFMNVSSYRNDLTLEKHKMSSFDIMEVYRAQVCADYSANRFITWYNKKAETSDIETYSYTPRYTSTYECMYNREDKPKSVEMTVSEIADKLNISNLKIISGKDED